MAREPPSLFSGRAMAFDDEQLDAIGKPCGRCAKAAQDTLPHTTVASPGIPFARIQAESRDHTDVGKRLPAVDHRNALDPRITEQEQEASIHQEPTSIVSMIASRPVGGRRCVDDGATRGAAATPTQRQPGA
ncbi:hypothetical protein GCM10029978_068940 [Actinoallomurus acanthiterrae]